MLDRIGEVDDTYAYYHDGGDGPGSLVRQDADGDTILHPHPGRWTVLEPADNRADAAEKARAWEAAE